VRLGAVVQSFTSPPAILRFGVFELDPHSGELRKKGMKIKLHGQPIDILALLMERPGQVVTREEIQNKLWSDQTFVDFEQGLNNAMKRLRSALDDNAESPHYIETVPRKGYRFIGTVDRLPQNGAGIAAPAAEKPRAGERPGKSRKAALVVVALLFSGLVAALFLGANFHGWRDRIFAKHRIGPIHSLAVLPLANLSGDPAQDYYADGMTDELITVLAENRSLRVVSRTSTMQYKGVNRPLREIAQALGVDGILEGSVNRSASHVHVNLQLIYAPTDTHVWAQSYDRDLNGALLLPQEMSQVIATEAKVASAPAKVKRYISPEAHDAYLRGRYFWFAQNYDESKKYFEKATELQPDYAAAWDGLGDSYGQNAVDEETAPEAAFENQKRYTLKALELDDSLPEAHNSMAVYYFCAAWDWKRAEAESLRAIELNPNYAEAHNQYSHFLTAMNRDEEALREQQRSQEIDPFARPWALGLVYIRLRHYDEAIHALQMGAEVRPRDLATLFFLFEAYWFEGMKKEAGQTAERMFEIEGDHHSADTVQQALNRGVDPPVGELLLRQDQEFSRKGYRSPLHLAWDYAVLQRKEETLRALEDSFRERAPLLVFLQREPAFDFLHSEPRYRALVAKMGLPPAS